MLFSVLDFVSGYWKLLLDEIAKLLCGVITPAGAYSSTRVLQGLRNAVAHFQSSIAPLFHDLKHCLKAFPYDFNLFNDSIENQFLSLELFFSICDKHDLFLSAKKCKLTCIEFFLQEVKWCGRIIDKNGYHRNPTHLQSISYMYILTHADELCQFLNCCRWIKSTIPDFVPLSTP